MTRFKTLRGYHFNLVLATVAVFILWELAKHFWLMRLPMGTYHLVDALGSTLWFLLVAGVVFTALARYEESLRAANQELQDKNRRLQALEDQRDTGLIELAQQLGLALTELRSVAQVSLQTASKLSDIKAYSNAIDRADELSTIVDKMIVLKQQHDVARN